MTGSKRISELDTIANIDITANDSIPFVDYETDSTKKITYAQLEQLLVAVTSFNSRFDTALSGKNSDALSEGVSNIYYTSARFNADLFTKSTTDLSEGSRLYYTDARVNVNTNVAANTTKRHDALTLATEASDAGLSLTGQELSHQAASSSQNGYLSNTDWSTFNGKAPKGPSDTFGNLIDAIVENQAALTQLGSLELDEATVTYAEFTFFIHIEDNTDPDYYQTVKVYAHFDGTTWEASKVDLLGVDSKLDFNVESDGLGKGIVKYTSGAYVDFAQGDVKYKLITM